MAMSASYQPHLMWILVLIMGMCLKATLLWFAQRTMLTMVIATLVLSS